MKKSFLSLIIVVYSFSGLNAQRLSYQQNPVIDNSAYVNTVPLSNVSFNGNSLYTNDGSHFLQVNLGNPSTANILFSGHAIEGDFDDHGILYFTSSTSPTANLYSADLTAGVTTLIGSLYGPNISSYDYILSMSFYNGSMYATFANNGGDSDIYTIHLGTGACSKVNATPMPGFFTVLAIDKTGTFYGIEADANDLYRINPLSGSVSLVGHTSLYTYEYCDADFNNFDNTLYFIGQSNGICTINTTDASVSQISNVEGYICAADSPSGIPVPVHPAYLILSFLLIAGGIWIRCRLF
ncbi:MAG TPA: hypothetical protein PLK12_08640 [Prolixibacteraceae bacterium]|nr:hypothetical protein [Prolixibacteraceae bacterium]